MPLDNTELLQDVAALLDRAGKWSAHDHSSGQYDVYIQQALQALTRVVVAHERANLRVAQEIYRLADALGWPVNSLSATRAQLRAIANLLAADSELEPDTTQDTTQEKPQ